MKKTLILAACIMLCCGTAMGWGRKGHATIARIAEMHLTKTTQKKIAEIMHGEPVSGYASYADEHKGKLLVDFGFEPTDGSKRINTLPHTFEANMDFEPFRGVNDNGRYVKNCIHFIEQYAEDLRNYKALDDSTAFTELVLLVHFVGDMHCPEHIRYNPGDMTIGYYDVTFRKEPIRYHTLWDSLIIEQTNPWSFGDLAYMFDSATSSCEFSTCGPRQRSMKSSPAGLTTGDATWQSAAGRCTRSSPETPSPWTGTMSSSP